MVSCESAFVESGSSCAGVDRYGFCDYADTDCSHAAGADCQKVVHLAYG